MLIYQREIDYKLYESEGTNHGLYSYLGHQESDIQEEYANYGDDPEWQLCKIMYFLGMGSDDESQRFYNWWKFGI